ncbi:MAG: pseudouridine synthase [Myxococcota bacterium]
MQERLQKILAQSGVASRRAAEKLITDGRVKVNGEVVSVLGAKADPDNDTIEVEGYGTLEREPVVYLLMNKPPQVVTTVSDPERRHTVIDVLEMSRAAGKRQFEGDMPRVYPVGRLDFDAEGALLLTNDGTLTNRLLHPKNHVPKTYLVKLRGRPEDRQLQRLRNGVRLKESDGSLSRPTKPANVVVVKESPANTWVELTIFEGRHHQVKRMCEAIGHGVLRLVRTDFAGVPLDNLPTGAWRFLDKAEIATLRGWLDGSNTALAQRPERTPPAKGARKSSTATGRGGSRDGARTKDSRGKGARGKGARSKDTPGATAGSGTRGSAPGRAGGESQSGARHSRSNPSVKHAPGTKKKRKSGPKKGKGSTTRGQRR